MPSSIFPPRDRTWHPPALTPQYGSSVLRSPSQPLLRIESEGPHRAGPTFDVDILGALDNDLIRNFAVATGSDGEAIGPRIAVHGQVVDENAQPIRNALLEIWQSNAAGRYRHMNDGYLAPLDPNFGGCGRCMTDADGAYSFMTVQPAPYPFPNGPNAWRPAHIHFSIFGDTFEQRLITQMYFEGDPMISRCPIVSTLADDRAVDALTARIDMEASVSMDHLAYRFDIVLRGPRATMFENKREGT